MPYVQRNARGEIESVHRASGPDALEYLDGADREIAEFFGQAADQPSRVEPELVRMLEEAVDLLLAKGVLGFDELSQEARETWLLRKDLKAHREKRRFAASGFVEIIDDSAFGALRGPGPSPDQK